LSSTRSTATVHTSFTPTTFYARPTPTATRASPDHGAFSIPAEEDWSAHLNKIRANWKRSLVPVSDAELTSAPPTTSSAAPILVQEAHPKFTRRADASVILTSRLQVPIAATLRSKMASQVSVLSKYPPMPGVFSIDNVVFGLHEKKRLEVRRSNKGQNQKEARYKKATSTMDAWDTDHPSDLVIRTRTCSCCGATTNTRNAKLQRVGDAKPYLQNVCDDCSTVREVLRNQSLKLDSQVERIGFNAQDDCSSSMFGGVGERMDIQQAVYQSWLNAGAVDSETSLKGVAVDLTGTTRQDPEWFDAMQNSFARGEPKARDPYCDLPLDLSSIGTLGSNNTSKERLRLRASYLDPTAPFYQSAIFVNRCARGLRI